MEAGVLALVCLSPWAFGAVEPEHEFLVDLGIAVLMILWGVRMLLEGKLSWAKCPVASCLAAWILLGVLQLTPLPRGLLGRVSPVTADYDRLLPANRRSCLSGCRWHLDDVRRIDAHVLSGLHAARGGQVPGYIIALRGRRQRIASPGSLRRLGIAALLNGSLLALFGLVQAFSSDPGMIYWSYPTPGADAVFGPFINRNHFAFHMNVCVGLGAGLLLCRSAGGGRMQCVGEAESPGRPGRLRRLDPVAIGMIFALWLMISSMVYSLSRGGFLALLGGSILGLAIQLPRARWSARRRIVLLTLVTVASLVSWFGYDRVVTRLGSLQDG